MRSSKRKKEDITGSCQLARYCVCIQRMWLSRDSRSHIEFFSLDRLRSFLIVKFGAWERVHEYVCTDAKGILILGFHPPTELPYVIEPK